MLLTDEELLPLLLLLVIDAIIALVIVTGAWMIP